MYGHKVGNKTWNKTVCATDTVRDSHYTQRDMETEDNKHIKCTINGVIFVDDGNWTEPDTGMYLVVGVLYE